MKDSYLQKGKRRKLVEGIRKKGVSDERVLKAMEELPRHFFMAKDFESWAYEDKAFPIGNDQTISQPYTVAYQTALLEVQPREKILEIGTGSGYQASILSLLGGRVYTIERQKELYEKARKLFKKLGFGGIRVFYKDGYLGLPEFAPFDKILVTAGASEIPRDLLKQLTIGGKMVIPVGKEVQTMYCITRLGEDHFEEKAYADFRFVPFLKGIN